MGNDDILEVKFRYFIILSLILHISILFFFRPDFEHKPEGFRPTYVQIVELPSPAPFIEKKVEIPPAPKSGVNKSKNLNSRSSHERIIPPPEDKSGGLASNHWGKMGRSGNESEIPSGDKKVLDNQRPHQPLTPSYGDPSGKSIRGLPLMTDKDLERFAKLEEPTLKKKEKSITLDTEEFRYLSYLERLKNRIEFIWKYPEKARLDHLQGDLYIRFSILKNGRLGGTEILRSSGYKILDDAALQALRDSDPFWPLPDSWDIQEFTITGHFIYYLGGLYLR